VVQQRDRFVLCIVRDFMVSLLIMVYRTIILPVVLYGCETWSLTLREERKLRVLEYGVEENIWT